MLGFDHNNNIWPGIKICGNSSQLHINEACLRIKPLQLSYELLVRNVECHTCDYKSFGMIQNDTDTFFVMDASYAQELRIGRSSICNVTKWFESFGLYEWDIRDGKCHRITVAEDPERFVYNLMTVIAFYFLIFVCYRLLTSAWCRRLIHRNGPVQDLEVLLGDPGSRNRNLARTRRLARVASVDVFRGIAVLLMIFVNYGGGKYSFFEHAPWNGLSMADVVFPFFIWIMGLSAVLSLRSRLRASVRRKDIFFKVLRRSMILICVGVVLNSGKNPDRPLRIPGVLQRIGLTYFILASIEVCFGRSQRIEQYGPWNVCTEMIESSAQWVFIGILTATHLLLTFLLAVPGCPTGYLGPGGLADYSAYPNCTGGAAGFIDRIIFTSKHIYQRPTSEKIFHAHQPYDPEGLLGVLTSVLLAFLGGHCGRIILTYQQTSARIKRWLLWAVITGLTAGFLCSWSKEEGVIPVNKNLWSLSYVLACCSMAFILFTILYIIVDHFQIFLPIVYTGMNPFVIYIGHTILNKNFPWRWTPVTSTQLEILFMNVTATVLWHTVAFILYKNNIFISL